MTHPDLYGVRMATTCAAHRHRELVPVQVHHVHPRGMGGPDVAANRVTLCANGHYSVHALLDQMLKSHRAGLGPLPWSVRRQYGRTVRQLAERGYAAVVAAGR